MKKKGFTLIELLAVIIVLGIIALIAVPLISNVINESKEKAGKVSAQVYVRAIEDKIAKDKLLGKSDFKDGKTYLISEDTSLIDLDTNLSEIDGETELDVDTSFYLKDVIKVRGNAPEDGYVTIENGKVADAAFVVKGMLVSGTAEDIKSGNVDPRKFSGGSNVSNIVINNKKEGLLGGESYQLDITVNTKDGEKPDRKTTYTSSNESVATISNDGTITAVNEGTTVIKVIVGKKEKSFILTVYNGSLLGYVGTIEETGIYQTTVNGVTYDLDVTVLEGDQTITSNTSYGRQDNCATGTATNQMAKRMAVVKVKGNYTVNSGVTVGPTYNTTYGGPKGFMLYVTGKLTNNGTIDNSHGAYATGQNVYLYKNADNTYEYIPAVGGTAGAGLSGNQKPGNSGGAGSTVNKRATGGGGSGASHAPSKRSGSGAAGSSYSGGSGGGASYSTEQGDSAGANGGAGGNGYYGGGAGNPGGTSTNVSNANTGTGGLLIIYSNEFVNSGKITADGKDGRGGFTGGGASGGGSINIFTNQPTNINQLGVVVNDKYNSMIGNVTVKGGTGYTLLNGSLTTTSGGAGGYAGGNGGNGTISAGEIRNGQYYDLKTVIQQDIDAYAETLIKRGSSILEILNNNPNLTTGYWQFKVNEGTDKAQTYSVHLYVYDGDQNWNGKVIGLESDCASGESNDRKAKNMVIAKVNGNLTNTGEIRPAYNTTYGGPKGFMLYVTGTLNNTGTIDNSHGAYANGQDVYLWKNDDNTFEYVPAVGAIGGDPVSGGSKDLNGNQGKAGSTVSKRALGGGGSGSVRGFDGPGSLRGGTATSYSGGAGSATGISRTGYPYNQLSGQAPSNIGGRGGQVTTTTWANTSETVAGTGNPGGCYVNTGGERGYCGLNGTGGLLIIYANEYNNTGYIKANGTNGVTHDRYWSSGASGGGSINIFYQTLISKGDTSKVTANGGAGGSTLKCGVGGTGTINYTKISF